MKPTLQKIIFVTKLMAWTLILIGVLGSINNF